MARPVRGHLWWREQYLSICSQHQADDPTCPRCQHGSWVNVWRTRVGQFVFAISPSLWRWWTNWKR